MVAIAIIIVVTLASGLNAGPEKPWQQLITSQQQLMQQWCPNVSLECSGPDNSSCPPGLFCKHGHCECGVYPPIIMTCNGTVEEFLATFSEDKVIGSSLYSWRNVSIFYHVPLPSSVSDLNDYCKSMNKAGRLCGQCLPDYYPMAYSYNTTCIKCPHVRQNWVRYIIAAYLPLTIFYLIIVFFRINTTSAANCLRWCTSARFWPCHCLFEYH